MRFDEDDPARDDEGAPENGGSTLSELRTSMKLLPFALSYFLRWALYAILIGAVVALITYAFEWTLDRGSGLLSHTWLWGLPVAGGLGVAVFIKWDKRVASDGIQAYLNGATREHGVVSILLVPMKFLASLFTLATGGSGGRAGPVVLMGGSFGSWISLLGGKDREKDRHTATMCGAAAAMGALLGVPLGGGIFAAEVLSEKGIRYRGLFPAILASTIGHIVRSWFPSVVSPFEKVRNATEGFQFTMAELLPIFGVAVMAGLVGMCFALLHHAVEREARALRKVAWLVPAIGSVLVVILAWVTLAMGAEGTEVMGTGVKILERSMTAGADGVLLKLAIVVLIFKMLTTMCTVGSGGSGGMFYPALILGAMSGNIISQAVSASQTTHFALVSAAIAVSLAAILNVPIAACAIMIEMFGTAYVVPIVLGATIGFMVGRPAVIYHYGRRGVHTKPGN